MATTLCYFVKYDIEQPWGDFDAFLELKENLIMDAPMHDSAEPNKAAAATASKPRAIKILPAKLSSVPQDGTPMQVNCPACTYLNLASATTCEVCKSDMFPSNSQYNVNI